MPDRMDPIATTAASGMRARMESLDMLANNIANASTAGYKVDREFYSLYSDAMADDNVLSPVIEKPWTDFSQGTLQVTGKPLDLALNGTGFFAVNSPSGTLYTRNGSFQTAPSGNVVTAEGYALRLTGGTPRSVDSLAAQWRLGGMDQLAQAGALGDWSSPTSRRALDQAGSEPVSDQPME